LALTRRSVLAGFGAALLGGCDGGKREAAPERALSIAVHPFSQFVHGSDERRFGDLEFLWGAELDCPDADFGGFSGLCIPAPGKRFLAINDQGKWLTGNLVLKNGMLDSVSDAMIAPMRNADGQTLTELWQDDTESLAFDGTTAFVGAEIENTILTFPIARAFAAGKGFDAGAGSISMPPDAADLHPLFGFEALGFLPARSAYAGAMIAIGEDDPAEEGRIPGFILRADGPVLRFRMRKEGRFRITDLAFLPGGDMLVLERAASVWSTLRIRIRRVALGEIQDGAEIGGKTIFEAGTGTKIDNMEGLSIHENAAGEAILTMISDNNFSVLQRTLLLQWRMAA
jgi:hypothetical protein